MMNNTIRQNPELMGFDFGSLVSPLTNLTTGVIGGVAGKRAQERRLAHEERLARLQTPTYVPTIPQVPQKTDNTKNILIATGAGVGLLALLLLLKGKK